MAVMGFVGSYGWAWLGMVWGAWGLMVGHGWLWYGVMVAYGYGHMGMA